ncbi:MAG TPA: zinc ribbon domain-containing protein [Thermoanaerobaculia bacterium]|mgnify:FL=1|nr:zinc ribbon domain-containing protein [Thermoanaerobaculia bacterium]HUM31170.1 zinc ribbon domain-containing protein [Thermoanaerobaculia bacterium]HXK69530.1 zinc ribbon domain-containing protein [Thermoanaerobaculia bacterium]
MPLYEYACQACGESFEMLVFSSAETVDCPSCGSEDVRKKVSAVGLSGGGCVSTGSGFT